jgi:hypothetical protein
MATITYTALRDMEPTITVVASNISAAAADDSFNAASGLLGFLNDEWILVSGFVNAANNGWFQLSANSTALKISQDTTTSLVTEAAGPLVTIKGYKRGYNQPYQMEFSLDQADRRVAVVKSVQRALSGVAAETLLQRRDVFLDVASNLILETGLYNIKQWREFFASVESGESFTFDRYGTIALPVEPKSAVLEGEGYTESRDSNLMRYRISYGLRLLN